MAFDVVTSSKSFICEPGKTCIIDVSDTDFDETFTAEPVADGISYMEWAKKRRSFCGRNSTPCRLVTTGFGEDPALMAILADDEEIFYLEPVFFSLTSPSFAYGEKIPRKFTCDGSNYSPELVWSGIPSKAKSLTLVVDDPDAPRQNPWVHWIAYNLPVKSTGLPENLATFDYPEGTRSGRNDFGGSGYGGPCPPSGTHRYFFKLYALDTMLPDLQTPTVGELESAMNGHIIGQAVAMGTYSYP